MESQVEVAAGEIEHLQRCINDLVSLLALPAIWSGGDPSQVLQTLLDALMRMLCLDLISARLTDPAGEAPVEIVRIAEPRGPMPSVHEICEALSQSVNSDPPKWPPLLWNIMGDGNVSIVPLPLGLQGELGVIVAAAQRAGFPRQTEALLLSAAANQVSIGLQEARLRRQQKRLTAELDQLVAQRTDQLTAANEALKRQLAEHKLVEERLGHEESELKRTEVRKAAILDSALDCIVTIDDQGRITEFNPAAEKTFGYRRGEVLGRHMADVIIPPSLREMHRQGFARHLATGESRVLGRRIELTAVRADSSEFPVELAITRIPLDGPPSFTGFLRDITEHKRNEDALRDAHLQVARSEERWRSVFENSAIGVALADLKGRFFAVNPVFEEMLGYTEEELQTLSFLDITHEEDLEPNRTLVDELLAGNRRQFQIEKQYRRKNGSLVWVRNNVSLISGTDRVPGFLLALSENITERKLAEEDRSRAEQALRSSEMRLSQATRTATIGEFAASIAHEINQPLAAVVANGHACLRWLSARPPGLAKAQEAAERIVRDGTEAGEVVRRIRALFKHAPLERLELNLNEVVAEVLRLLSDDTAKRRVGVETDLADDLPAVIGDRVQLQQLIFNLLVNGMEAMDPVADRPKKLVVRTKQQSADDVLVEIQDSGIGLADPEKIFEAFFTTKENGMGMGLSICRSIIDAHHGRLWATSAEGQGTVFSFTLPFETRVHHVS